MKKPRTSSKIAFLASIILSFTLLSISNASSASGAAILFHSDSQPGIFSVDELTQDFNESIDLLSVGSTYDCVQSVGDVSPIDSLDQAFNNSVLSGSPHFMCVGNHDAEQPGNNSQCYVFGDPGGPNYMQAIRDKYAGYPDWNLNPGPSCTSETTYSYDVGDIHVVVLNLYWNGIDNDAWFKYSSTDGGYITDALFTWLKNDLRTSEKPYKIVVGHEAAYPFMRHVGDSLDADYENRNKFLNLLRTERVFAYVSGHCHYYNLKEYEGVFQINTGVSGGHVGTTAEDVATLGYAQCDSGGFQFVLAKENPTWDTPYAKTVSMSDIETQVLVNTAEGAGTVCRYFIDFTGNVESNPDWTNYDAWWEDSFDDVGANWSDGELAVGYDSTNPAAWGWHNQPIDPDPDNSGNEQVYGVFTRIPFNAYNIGLYLSMELGVDYDDAIIVWLNGTKIFQSSNSPTISSDDYWDKLASEGHEANGDEALNPDFDVIDVSSYMSSLNEGSNLLVIGNWNREPGSSDIMAAVKLYLESRAITLITPAEGEVLPVSSPATFSWEAGSGYRYKMEFSPIPVFFSGSPKFPVPPGPIFTPVGDTTTDDLPVQMWIDAWDIIKKIEQINGVVYWRVIGRDVPPAPLDISRVRSFRIE